MTETKKPLNIRVLKVNAIDLLSNQTISFLENFIQKLT